MKSARFYWITAIFYAVFIFILSVFALPAAAPFGGQNIYDRTLPWICGLFAGGVLLFLWKNRTVLSRLKQCVLFFIFAVYALFYFKLEFRIEEIHLINFAVLTFLFIKSLKASSAAPPIAWKASALTVLIGASDELLQKFIPGRVADWRDIGLCVIGVTLGNGLTWIFSGSREKI